MHQSNYYLRKSHRKSRKLRVKTRRRALILKSPTVGDVPGRLCLTWCSSLDHSSSSSSIQECLQAGHSGPAASSTGGKIHFIKKCFVDNEMIKMCWAQCQSRDNSPVFYTRYLDALAVTTVITRSRRRRRSFTTNNTFSFKTNIKRRRLWTDLSGSKPDCSVKTCVNNDSYWTILSCWDFNMDAVIVNDS